MTTPTELTLLKHAGNIVKAAKVYAKASADTRKCTELILSSGTTDKSRKIMARFMKAEKDLLDLCGMDVPVPQRKCHCGKVCKG